MTWVSELFVGSSLPHVILTFSFVIALGLALGRIKFFGVALGATFVLLVGIATSHFGMLFPERLFADPSGAKHFINPVVLNFLKDFGLLLFIYAVGLQVGPNFFPSLKKGGLVMNFLAVMTIALNIGVALLFHFTAKIEISELVGVLSGAVTNTPGLGAAQMCYQNAGGDPNVLANAYATAYPFGVLGIIFSILIVKTFGKVEKSATSKETPKLEVKESTAQKVEQKSEEEYAAPIPKYYGVDSIALMKIFIGIFFGILLGSVPIPIPGVAEPLKLGLAGGSLVVAIFVGALRNRGHFLTRLSPNATLMMRETGMSLFLAAVGLGAGETFVDSVVHGGVAWMGVGIVITVLPLLIVGFLARRVFKIDYYVVAGFLSGVTTDPPALSYSLEAAGNNKPSEGYATVYPLTMFLRIITAQALVSCM